MPAMARMAGWSYSRLLAHLIDQARFGAEAADGV
jgi:hypothetical protein